MAKDNPAIQNISGKQAFYGMAVHRDTVVFLCAGGEQPPAHIHMDNSLSMTRTSRETDGRTRTFIHCY